MPVE
jgi:hypothetical protein